MWQPIETANQDDVILGYCPGYGTMTVEMFYGRWASTLETTSADWQAARDM